MKSGSRAFSITWAKLFKNSCAKIEPGYTFYMIFVDRTILLLGGHCGGPQVSDTACKIAKKVICLVCDIVQLVVIDLESPLWLLWSNHSGSMCISGRASMTRISCWTPPPNSIEAEAVSLARLFENLNTEFLLITSHLFVLIFELNWTGCSPWRII